MLNFCVECDRRDSCDKLCEEAVAYVNEDNVFQTEYIVMRNHYQNKINIGILILIN